MNKRGQLLIVDDEPDIAIFIQEMLQGEAYSTETASTGEEALSVLERSAIDIMVTDIRMPGMGGLELLQQARESQPDLSCMIITGHGDMDTAVQALKLGAVDFFTKPIDFMKLEQAIAGEMERLWLKEEIRQQQEEISLFNQKLGREIRKNQVILHAAGQGIVGLDEQGEITFINPVAREILGWQRDELIASTFADLVSWDNDEECLSLPAIPPYGSRFVGQTFFRRKDGTLFPVEYVKSLIADDKSEGSVLVFEDITERQAQQEKLSRAKIEAEEANLAKSNFLARMSHDIRTPMNGILGIGELLLADKLTQRQEQLCRTMQQSGRFLLQLINNVLDLSKIESGKLELLHEAFDLEQLLERSLETIGQGADRKGLGLAYRIEAGVERFLMGDSHKLQQILVNLLANAIKFTEQGEVAVRISSLESGRDGDMLCFEIEDTGIGVPNEAQSHIFDSFVQTNSSTSCRYGGTGLGLTIVQHLAAMMGGEVGLFSSPGKGSTFWFTALVARQQARDDRGLGERPPLLGLRVLLIGQYPLGLRFLEEQLQEWKAVTVSTEQVSEGVLLFLQSIEEQDPYDVVLLDVGANAAAAGIELASIITEKAVRETSLFLVTGLNGQMQDAVAMVRKAGPVVELSRPVHPSELYTKLQGRQRAVLAEFPAAAQEEIGTGSILCRLDAGILLVDDNETNQLVVGEMLALAGCRPDVASDGCEALAMLAQREYDLVFMDCQMPEMDGFEATKMIRRREGKVTAGKHTPVVAMTANALQADRKNCLAAGMDDYLSKPFTLDQLNNKLQRWLQGKSTDGMTCPPPVENGCALQQEKKNVPARIDYGMLERLRSLQEKTGSNMLEELLVYFIDDAPKTMALLQRAIEGGEWDLMKEEAHRFKSSCANLGAVSMVVHCHRLQKFEDFSEEKAMELLQVLQEEYQEVKKLLASEFKACKSVQGVG